MKIRTRFAPSPTGFMHVGNLRTALYEYLTAKHEGGTFVLRIEDTDRERYVEGATQVIYDTMKLAGLTHDEGPDIGGEYGPYVQSERLSMYKPYAEQLVEQGKAYRCFCTKERLEALKENAPEGTGYDRHCRDLSPEEIQKNLDADMPYVIRQKMPLTGSTSYHDLVYGDITFPNEDLDDQVLIKTDGFPTYNFANVIGEIPTYIHLPLIMGKSVDEEGNEVISKLSKRHGSTGFMDLVNEGYLPEAIINYIALLGWAPKDTREIFSLPELIEAFDINGISKSPAVFDYDKLSWVNQEHIKAMSDEEFLKHAKPFYDEAGVDPSCYALLAELLKPRIAKFNEITEKLSFIKEYGDFDLALFEHKKSKSTLESSKEMLEKAIPVLENSDWDRDTITEAMKTLAESLEVKNSVVMWPVRIAAAGVAVTPGGCAEVMLLLGKEESLKRIKYAYSRL